MIGDERKHTENTLYENERVGSAGVGEIGNHFRPSRFFGSFGTASIFDFRWSVECGVLVEFVPPLSSISSILLRPSRLC